MVRRLLSAIIVIGFVGILFAQEVAYRHITAIESSQADTIQQKTSGKTPQRRRIDFMADEVKPYNRTGDSIVYFVGNFAAHHNGAVITCDSAVRYSDQRWGFFGQVLVNQDSIYIYGDSAIYDGDASMAEIYAPIIKVVDGDALLYTYNFRFNTEKKIGSYTDGGVLVHDDNIIESVRGYYDAENHDIICVDKVELHGEDYDMKSDSIIYNTDTEFARFFTHSEIWNADGDYLSADRGHYDKQQDLYMVTRNGYILSKDQEVWGDTLSYFRSAGHVVGYGNIQMDDFKQKMLAFGDYAEYWSEPGDALLTRNPSIVSYDLSQSDSVFMSGDTLQIFTISLLAEREAAEEQEAKQEEESKQKAEQAAERQRESLARQQASRANANQTDASNNANTQQSDNTATGDDSRPVMAEPQGDDAAEPNEVLAAEATDSVAQDSLPQLTPKQQKALEQKQAKDVARKVKEAKKKEKMAARKVHLDSIAKIRQAKVTAMLEKVKAKELERMAKDSVRRALKREKLLAKGEDVSAMDSLDSMARLRNERVLRQLEQRTDTVDKPKSNIPQAEEVVAKEEDKKGEGEKGDSISADSVYRLVKAYRNVKMFRKDAQMICDSLTTTSLDSIVHLYISPVLWNGSNQLASETMDLHTRNQKLERAEFDGTPIMVAVIDSTYFNQVAGKKMIAYFRDNEIYRNDVDGNVQTIYFQREDEKTTLVTEMIYLESASASFYIENKELVGMTYRNDVPFTMYPINQVPESQPLKLPNFKWVPALRPELDDVFTRTIRPSRREDSEQRRRPMFNIVNVMDRRKEAFIRSGQWVDREDELTPEVVEWRDSRGM
ncbi:MAG: hypothetical protein J6A72_03915 [Alistipes sp.]|nr:hypothetical protein [Alistipes sp.]